MTMMKAACVVHNKTPYFAAGILLALILAAGQRCLAADEAPRSKLERAKSLVVRLMEKDKSTPDYCKRIMGFLDRHPEFEIDDSINDEYDGSILELEVFTRKTPHQKTICYLVARGAKVTGEMVSYWEKEVSSIARGNKEGNLAHARRIAGLLREHVDLKRQPKRAKVS